MDIISVEHSDNLFWLGRYTERVYTTLKTFFNYFDKGLDSETEYYKDFLEKLGISREKYANFDEFTRKFLYDESEIFSLVSTFECAYNNAVVMRETVGSEALSYIQLAYNKFRSGKDSRHLRYTLLPVVDYLLAFWGCIESSLPENEVTTIIHCGQLIERLDLYFRFSYPYKMIETEYEKLCHKLATVEKGNPYSYNTAQLSVLVEVVGMRDDYGRRLEEVLACLNKLFEAEAA